MFLHTKHSHLLLLTVNSETDKLLNMLWKFLKEPSARRQTPDILIEYGQTSCLERDWYP
jgi:hypothetical protein